jgi:hypothetical protein
MKKIIFTIGLLLLAEIAFAQSVKIYQTENLSIQVIDFGVTKNITATKLSPFIVYSGTAVQTGNVLTINLMGSNGELVMGTAIITGSIVIVQISNITTLESKLITLIITN